MDHVYGDVTGGMCLAVDCSAAIASVPVVAKLPAPARVVHFAMIQHSGCSCPHSSTQGIESMVQSLPSMWIFSLMDI